MFSGDARPRTVPACPPKFFLVRIPSKPKMKKARLTKATKDVFLFFVGVAQKQRLTLGEIGEILAKITNTVSFIIPTTVITAFSGELFLLGQFPQPVRLSLWSMAAHQLGLVAHRNNRHPGRAAGARLPPLTYSQTPTSVVIPSRVRALVPQRTRQVAGHRVHFQNGAQAVRDGARCCPPWHDGSDTS